MGIRGIHTRPEARAVAEGGVGARAIRGGEVCEAGASPLHWDDKSTNQGEVVPFQNNDNLCMMEYVLWIIYYIIF